MEDDSADASEQVQEPATAGSKASEGKIPVTGRRGPAFDQVTDPDEILMVHNELALTATELGINVLAVEKFDSVEAGHRACYELYEQVQEAKAAAAKVSKPKKEKKVKGITAVKAVKKAAAPKKTPAKAAVPKKAAAAPKGDAEVRNLKYAADSKITWVGDANPFREGSGRHERTELLRKHNGKTVKKFMEAGGRTGTISYCEEKGLVKVG